MDHLRLMLMTIESPKLLSGGGRISDFEDNISEIAARVQQNPEAITHGTFQTRTEKMTYAD